MSRIGQSPSQLRCGRSVSHFVNRFGPMPALFQRGRNEMLWTIFVLLLLLWMLGLVTSYTLGGFIHILLIVAIAVLCIQLISGRRAI
jgi:hypothetical protein